MEQDQVRMEIRDLYEEERGCGYRRPGGLYLMQPEPTFIPCGRLPLTVGVCPFCGEGIRAARGWTWINPRALWQGHPCTYSQDPDRGCRPTCLLHDPPEKAGLIWIGRAFYETPLHWMEEAGRMGVSRRISSIPRKFVLGETWVFVGFKPATGAPYIFHAFKPDRLDYVVREDDTDERLFRMFNRGATLVRVHRASEQHQPGLFLSGPGEMEVPL